jgi:hypothetical protein
MEMLNLKDFEGWVWCVVRMCNLPKGGQDTGVGGQAQVSPIAGSLFSSPLGKQSLRVKRIEHSSSFMNNLANFQGAKIAHTILESFKSEDQVPML